MDAAPQDITIMSLSHFVEISKMKMEELNKERATMKIDMKIAKLRLVKFILSEEEEEARLAREDIVRLEEKVKKWERKTEILLRQLKSVSEELNL